MTEILVDFVVRRDDQRWSVCRRVLRKDASWLRSLFVSEHETRETAVVEVRERNAALKQHPDS